jgi:hypothetical protein
MNLTLTVAAMPLWLSGLLMVVVPAVLVACGPLLIRRLFPIESIAANNEVAGFKFATLGVVYAVLLGLAVISVWEKFAEADTAATDEAAALAAIDRLSAGLANTDGEALREAVAAYAHTVIKDDWPAMQRGTRATAPLAALNELYTAALRVTPNDARGAAILDALLTQLDLVTDARRTRLSLAEGILPNVIWLVLFIGALTTVGFTFFFGLHNLGAQMLMTGMLALLIFLSLFVAISIDHPYAGPAGIPPEALERVLRDFTLG